MVKKVYTIQMSTIPQKYSLYANKSLIYGYFRMYKV